MWPGQAGPSVRSWADRDGSCRDPGCVVLDAIAVRSLLVPALVALFGRLGMWPGNRRVKREPAPAAAPAPVRAGDQP
jgi:hypothetical protein